MLARDDSLEVMGHPPLVQIVADHGLPAGGSHGHGEVLLVPCGRTHKRLARFKGRSDDMIILKGVNLFPIQIEKILMQFKELGSNYLITIETVGNNDEMLIEVELSDLFTDDYSVLQRLTKEITRQLKDELLLTPHLKLVAKGSLPVQDGKAVRVKDLRKLC